MNTSLVPFRPFSIPDCSCLSGSHLKTSNRYWHTTYALLWPFELKLGRKYFTALCSYQFEVFNRRSRTANQLAFRLSKREWASGIMQTDILNEVPGSLATLRP